MRTTVTLLAVLLLACTSAALARDARTLVTTAASQVTVQATSTHRIEVGVDMAIARDILLRRDGNLSIALPLAGMGTQDVELRLSAAVTPMTRIHFTTPGGEKVLPASNNVIAYTGTLASLPSSIVTLVVTPQQVVARVDAGADNWTLGQSLDGTGTVKGVMPHVMTRMRQKFGSCGMEEGELSPAVREALNGKQTERTQATTDTLTLEISVEADYLFYRRMGNEKAALAYITSLMAFTDAVYLRDVATNVTTTDIHIWTTADDGYDDELDVFSILPQFAERYNIDHPDVHRDIALLFTARDNGTGGIAKTIGGLCGPQSYCAAGISGDLPSDPNASYSFDAIMVPHEIGHVCGGVHTQSCLWPGGPLDSCIVSESGSCVTSTMTAPTDGTLMSYCHYMIAQGGTISARFHDRHKRIVRSFIEQAPCIAARTPGRGAIVRGTVRNAITRQPIPNVAITIRPYVDSQGILDGTPAITGDSTAVTGADGTYMLSGLAYGFYKLAPSENYLPYPMEEYDGEPALYKIIGDPDQTIDMDLMPAQNIPISFFASGDSSQIHLVVAGNNLPDLTSHTVISLPANRDTTYMMRLPVGTYTIVPLAEFTTMTPRMQAVVAVANNKPAVIRFTRERVEAEGLESVLLTALQENGTSTLHGGDTLVVNDINSNPVGTYVADTNGIVIVDRQPTQTYLITELRTDTSRFVPNAGNIFYTAVGQQFGQSASVRHRHKPTYANTYSFAATNGTYTPITGGYDILAHDGAGVFPYKVDLPFSLRIGGVTTSTMWVYGRPVLVLGDNAPAIETHIHTSSSPATLVISAFDAGMQLAGSLPVSVKWLVEGTAPNRTFVAEWKNLNMAAWSVLLTPVNVQARLAEADGTITVTYGTMPTSGDQNPVPVAIGLRGADILDFQSVVAAAGTWNAPTIRTDGLANAYAQLSVPDGPASGLTYIWHVTDATYVDDRNYTGGTSEWSVGPNPATGGTIAIGGPERAAHIRLMDIAGRTVASVTDAMAIDITSVPSGVYRLVIEATSGTSHTVPLHVIR